MHRCKGAHALHLKKTIYELVSRALSGAVGRALYMRARADKHNTAHRNERSGMKTQGCSFSRAYKILIVVAEWTHTCRAHCDVAPRLCWKTTTTKKLPEFSRLAFANHSMQMSMMKPEIKSCV
jgi:hypothetical protein